MVKKVQNKTLDFLNGIWSFLDSKKTVIGTVLLIIANVLSEFHPEKNMTIMLLREFSLYLGTPIASIGLIHKLIKNGYSK